MTSSPFGSRFRHFVRFLALRLLTDGQRRSIKHGLARVRGIPARLAGIDQVMNAQKAEIERLKSRLTILDGKFNLALYGLPRVGEARSRLLSNSLIHQLESVAPENSAVRPAITYSPPTGASPRSTLLFDPIVATAASLGSLTVVGPDRAPGGSEVERIDSDPISALLGLGSHQFDLIACSLTFCELTPLEQRHFLDLASKRLTPGGTLVLQLPDLSDPRQLSDLYWTHPGALRPYSVSLVREALPQAKLEKAPDGRLLISWRRH